MVSRSDRAKGGSRPREGVASDDAHVDRRALRRRGSWRAPEPVLPVPAFYDPAQAARFAYRPDARPRLRARPAVPADQRCPPAATPVTSACSLIDVQRDFCFPEGSLYVGGRSGRGALEDNDRLARFIYRNLAPDHRDHLHPRHPLPLPDLLSLLLARTRRRAPRRPIARCAPTTCARARSCRTRTWPPGSAGGDTEWLRRQAEFYCESLEKSGTYTLYLWPPHCLAGR